MKIFLTGATGLIGQALCQYWLGQEHKLYAWVRDKSSAVKKLGNGVQTYEALADIPAGKQFDAIVNLAGTPIAGFPWTGARREKLYNSRIETTESLVQWVTERGHDHAPKVLISVSAAGYYGRRGDEALSEDEPAQNIFMSRLCADWEKAALTMAEHGVRVVIPRLSVVLSKKGGALPQLLLPHKVGLGAVFGKGHNYFPWVHIDDVVQAMDLFLHNERTSGPYNLVAPEAVTQTTFNKTLATTLKRPHFIKIPAPLVRLMMGEMSDLFLASQNMSAQKIADVGFKFRYPTLQAALSDLTT